MARALLLFALLGGCTPTGTFPTVGDADEPIAVTGGRADGAADPRWRDANELLARLAERCEERRLELVENASDARTSSRVANVVAVVLALTGELADTSAATPGVLLGDARCPAPAGPTTTLPGDEQGRAMGCGGMAAAGGAGPLAENAIGARVTAAEQVEAMRRSLDRAEDWLDTRRAWPEWSDEDATAWDGHVATLRVLCTE